MASASPATSDDNEPQDVVEGSREGDISIPRGRFTETLLTLKKREESSSSSSSKSRSKGRAGFKARSNKIAPSSAGSASVVLQLMSSARRSDIDSRAAEDKYACP